ncbi:MAG: carbohydrate-binding domain-containing protein [Oscillospiraceae bacterium]|nr:carbohydrate-binding domain-containing protein [Oscillospiraceae bacterium]
MKKNLINTMLFTAVLAYALAGCAMDPDTDTPAVTVGTAVTTEISDETTASDAGNKIEQLSQNLSSAVSALDTASVFTDRDLSNTPDLSKAKTLTVSDDAVLEITEEGVYVLRGTAKNCTVKVNADKSAKVQIVLDGVSITNSDFPAVYVVSADKVFVTTAEKTENTLSVTGTFRTDGETKTDAVIFSKDDLVLNGLGTLNITSAEGNGVSSKDDLKVTGGTYTFNTALDSLEANDMLAVADGSFTFETKKDAMNSESYVYIKDGTFTVNAKSDGVQGNVLVQIDGGTLTINSSEGIESTYVQINGGTIKINASDDGINASQKCEGQTPTVEITGGDITIVMAQGDTDGIDANGYIKVSGGKIDVTAPCMSFDYDKDAEYTGGTIIINGEQVNEIPKETMGGFGGGMRGGRGGMGGFTKPENGEMPEGFTKPENGEMPEGFTKPENGEMPEGFTKPEGGFSRRGQSGESGEQSGDGSAKRGRSGGNTDKTRQSASIGQGEADGAA